MAVYDADGLQMTTVYDADGNEVMFAYDADGLQVYSKVSPIQPTFLDVAVLTALTSCSETGTKQGATTDGTYIYQAVNTTNSIIKYRISDGEYTVTTFNSSIVNLGHANDLAYNPNTGWIYVSVNDANGTVVCIDASTMEYVRKFAVVDANYLPFTFWQMLYDRTTRHFYVSGGTSSYLIYDESFNYIKTMTTAERLSDTAQSDETDGTYIYRLTYNSSNIQVIDKATGEQIAVIAVNKTQETESLSYDWDGNWYMSFNTSGSVFYTVKLYEYPYEGKNISILGDSISTYVGYIPSSNANFYTGTNCGVTSVDQTWWMRVIKAFNMSLALNNSWSGSRVSTTNGTTSAGCMARATNLGNAPDVIIVYMGVNDFNHEVDLGTYDGSGEIPTTGATFTEAYGMMLNKIKVTYPNAEIFCSTLTIEENNGDVGDPEINDAGVPLTTFNDAIKQIAEAFGAKVIDLYNCGITYATLSTYMGDYSTETRKALHPNAEGHALIAQKAMEDMMK